MRRLRHLRRAGTGAGRRAARALGNRGGARGAPSLGGLSAHSRRHRTLGRAARDPLRHVSAAKAWSWIERLRSGATRSAANATQERKQHMKVIIVGGVAGGASCAARLRRLDEKAEILMVERGPYVSYANCGLPYHVGGVDRGGVEPPGGDGADVPRACSTSMRGRAARRSPSRRRTRPSS
ncbi:MAG: hypothetical protein MZV64_04815 [Ignavibacteriales bacterium]|nr:hypothetical protein [Ignavibacteriales bacterium]